MAASFLPPPRKPLQGTEMGLQRVPIFFIFLFFFVLCLLSSVPAFGPVLDRHYLLSFKSSADARNVSLSSWVGPDPCSGSWVGVRCRAGHVAGVVLDGESLVGDVSSLLRLPHLQVLSLRRNSLGGALPSLTTRTNSLLKHLFLSHNQLNGSLEVILPSLVSLRLEGNGFSGGLNGLRLPSVEDFNISGNLFSGEIPSHLSKFSKSAFGRNPSLCGSPLPSCITSTTSPMLISQSSPSPTPSEASSCSRKALSKLRVVVIVIVGVGDAVSICAVLAVVVGLYIWVIRRRTKHVATCGSPDKDPEIWVEESKKSETGLVCFGGGEDLRLDFLLKASAEVLGKGEAGDTYKAVLDDGLIVAVKRLDAECFPAGKTFDQHMHVIGSVRHRSMVSLRAYYNAQEEKLLVYDFMPNGSLQSLLQNNRRTRPVEWKSWMQILLGAAQGLDFIHNFPSRSPLVHANVKPSNILIDDGGNACVSEWGVMGLATDVRRRPSPPRRYVSSLVPSPSTSAAEALASAGWQRYRAPELLAGKRATQASDVYSFGMVLLEVVTDKEVGDAEAEEEVMGMVRIGMMCTKENPEERPAMSSVVRMIDEML